MELSEKESQIIALVENQADLQLSEIEKLSGLRKHVVRYHLSKLIERGVLIGPTPFLNVYPLGYTEYLVYWSMAAESRSVKAAFLKELIECPQVSWIGEMSGEFQYMMSYCAEHAESLQKYLYSLSARFGSVFHEKSVLIRTNFTRFGKRYLLDKKRKLPTISFGGSVDSVEVDQIDRKLLSYMANNNFSSMSELSRISKIPLTTLERRRRQLEQKGIVVGYFYLVNSAAFGMFPYQLLISPRSIEKGFRDKLYQFVENEPRFVFFAECLGAWDYEVAVEVSEASAIGAVIELLYESFGPQIGKISALPIYKYHKFRSYPFYE